MVMSLADVPHQQHEPERHVRGGGRRRRGPERKRVNGQRQHRARDGDAHDERPRRRTDELHDEQAEDDHAAAAQADEAEAVHDVTEEDGERQHPPEPHDQRREGEKPDQDHPLIIIAAVHESALEWLTDAILREVDGAEQPSPATVMFLLRRYSETGREELRGLVEQGLTSALSAVAHERDPRNRCEWLDVCLAATAVSDDERLATVVRSSTAATIDDLERVVSVRYQPGEGLADADLAEHVRSASALLIAYGITGRLPYSMLAEELVQTARRRWWDDASGLFGTDFVSNCQAVRVLSRLSALHADPEYIQTAVVARDSTCGMDARRILAALEPMYRAHSTAAAWYGLALLDCSR